MILILTAGFGDGHNTAARSVSEGLRRAAQDPAPVVDLFQARIPRLNRVLQLAYQVAIVHFPSVWRWVYQGLATNDLASRPNSLNSILQAELAGLINRLSPRALVSTYPFYATLLRPLREQGPVPPLFTIITDSITVHPSWTQDPSDHYCVPDEDTCTVLAERGLPRDRIHLTGFPVSAAFADPLQDLSSAQAGQRILYLPSTPARHVAATLEALRPLLRQGAKLTLAVGKHASRLHQTLVRFGDSLPPGQLEVLGWTDRMPELLRTHDLVICKAGGAILHEVLAARVPAVIDYIVPGQEEGNADLLIRHGCAQLSHSPTETAACAARILENDSRLGRVMRSAMIPPLSLPDAADRTARLILSLCPPYPLSHAPRPPL